MKSKKRPRTRPNTDRPSGDAEPESDPEPEGSTKTTSTSYSDELSNTSKKFKGALRSPDSRWNHNTGNFWWHADYDRRALLLRMAVERNTDNPELFKKTPSSIRNLRFFSKESVNTPMKDVEWSHCEFKLCPIPLQAKFEQMIKQGSPKMSLMSTGILDTPLFQEIRQLMEKCGFEYYEVDSGKLGWHSRETPQIPTTMGAASLDARTLMTSIGYAFCHDMKSGDGKEMLFELSMRICSFHGMDRNITKFFSPSTQHGSNTKVEVVSVEDGANFSRPYTLDPPTFERHPEDDPLFIPGGHYPFEKAHTHVPDYVWVTLDQDGGKKRKDNGKFLLVVEIKPECDIESGAFQCYNQLLSKLFFQDFVFGLLITPVRFRLIYAYKQNGVVHACELGDTFLTYNLTEGSKGVFKPEALEYLVEWLSKIMAYGKTFTTN